MHLCNEDLRMAVVTDPGNRIIAGFTDDDILVTQGFNLLFEKEIGDIRFIPLEDGSMQAIYKQKDVALPVGTIDSAELIKRYKEAQEKQQKMQEQTEVTVVDADSTASVDPLVDIEDDDDEIITVDESDKK